MSQKKNPNLLKSFPSNNYPMVPIEEETTSVYDDEVHIHIELLSKSVKEQDNEKVIAILKNLLNHFQQKVETKKKMKKKLERNKNIPKRQNLTLSIAKSPERFEEDIKLSV